MAFDQLLSIINLARGRFPGFGKRMEEAEALGRWDLAVGPAIAKHSRALRVDDGVLFVEVDHPIWKSELHHRKRQILDILNNGRPAGPAAPKSQPALGPAREILKDVYFVEPRGRQS